MSINRTGRCARAHLTGTDDALVVTRPLLERSGDFAAFLAAAEDPVAIAELRAAENTGRPLANPRFIEDLERILGRKLAKARPQAEERPSAAGLVGIGIMSPKPCRRKYSP